MQSEGCATNVCMCVSLPKAPHTKRTSLSDLPHLLSRQVVSTPEGELSSLSISIYLSLVCYTHKHMNNRPTHYCTQDIPGRSLIDSIHPEVMMKSKVKLLSCHVNLQTSTCTCSRGTFPFLSGSGILFWSWMVSAFIQYLVLDFPCWHFLHTFRHSCWYIRPRQVHCNIQSGLKNLCFTVTQHKEEFELWVRVWDEK